MTLPDSIQTRLNTQLDCLPAILHGSSAEALHWKSVPERWSAVQNLAHLARYHDVFKLRLDHILSEERPLLPRYSAEQDPAWSPWLDLPLDVVQRRLLAVRVELIAAIAQLPGSAGSRTAIHPKFGEMPLTLWVEFFLLHEAHHLYCVFQLARRRN